MINGLTKSVVGEGILADAWVIIQIVSLKLTKNFETSKALLDAKIIDISEGKPKKKSIQGDGVGLVDACFDAMIKCYNVDYCSLDTISIVDFAVNAHVDHGSSRKSDAKVTAMLHVKNSQNLTTFLNAHRHRSVIQV